jgi:hypothetical protein
MILSQAEQMGLVASPLACCSYNSIFNLRAPATHLIDNRLIDLLLDELRGCASMTITIGPEFKIILSNFTSNLTLIFMAFYFLPIPSLLATVNLFGGPLWIILQREREKICHKNVLSG